MPCIIPSQCAPTEFYGDVNILEGSDPLLYGYGDLFIQNDLFVNGDTEMCGNLSITGSSNFVDDAEFCGNVTIKGDLGVSGSANFSTLNVNDLQVSNDLGVTGSINTEVEYNINDVSVLSSNTLGNGVINSSLTSVGTLETLNVTGNVGIGTTIVSNPVIHGVGDLHLKMYNSSLNRGCFASYNVDDDENGGLLVGVNNANEAVIRTNSLKEINFDINSINKMTLTSGGDLSLTTGSDYQINDVDVLTETTLGSGVVNSSLTSVGTLSSLNVTNDINTTTDYNIGGTQVLSSTTLGSGIVNSSLTSNTGNLVNTGTLNLTTGNDYQINNTSVLNSTTLGSSVVNSSLTSNTGDLVNTGTLDVTSPGFIQSTFTSTNNSGGIKLKNFTNGQEWEFQSLNSTSAVGNIDNLLIYDRTAGAARMNIDTSGNVGIGIITPTTKLDVVGDINTSTDYNIGGTQVLSSTSLGSGIVNSSLTSNTGNLTNTGTLYITGNVGIGNNSPNSPLEFATTAANRKLVLFDNNNNDHQYYGFGINSNVLRYQTDNIASDHVFYAATSTTASNELFRIEGTGGFNSGTSALGGHSMCFLGERNGTASSTSYAYGDSSSATIGPTMPAAGIVKYLTLSTSASNTGTATLYINNVTTNTSVSVSSSFSNHRQYLLRL